METKAKQIIKIIESSGLLGGHDEDNETILGRIEIEITELLKEEENEFILRNQALNTANNACSRMGVNDAKKIIEEAEVLVNFLKGR